MIECKHQSDGCCRVSSDAAGVPVPLDESACTACSLQDRPMTANRVTSLRAAFVLRQAGVAVPADLVAACRPNPEGVGTQFERLVAEAAEALDRVGLGWLAREEDGCGCAQMKQRLNHLSATQVERRIDEFVEQINGQWLAKHPAFIPVGFATRQVAWDYLTKAIAEVRRLNAS